MLSYRILVVGFWIFYFVSGPVADRIMDGVDVNRIVFKAAYLLIYFKIYKSILHKGVALRMFSFLNFLYKYIVGVGAEKSTDVHLEYWKYAVLLRRGVIHTFKSIPPGEPIFFSFQPMGWFV